MHVVYGMFFFKNISGFVGSTNIINICLILSTIYILIPMSGYVGRGPSAILCQGPVMLLRRPLVQLTIKSVYL